MKTLKTPYADLLYPLSYEEFGALRASIEHDKRVRDPIIVDEDSNILDGHHRYKIATADHHHIKFDVVVKSGLSEAEKQAFVYSSNFARRNLSPEQKIELRKRMKEVALELKKGGKTQAEIGALLGMPRTTVETWFTSIDGIVNTSKPPDNRTHLNAEQKKSIAAEVERGNKTQAAIAAEFGCAQQRVSQIAAIEQRKAERERRRAEMEENDPPNKKYRVFYADPPWQYNDAGVINESDGYGHAERHYPTLSIEALCAMGAMVKDLAEDNAALFLWVTSPMLEDSFKVIAAWGFEYKTSFVWDKVKHNFGHYNSVRHEFLLVCTRGSCVPDAPDKIDSVQMIERSDRHSEKPEEFRVIIDHLYTSGNRIELFARSQHEGWDTWGNEV